MSEPARKVYPSTPDVDAAAADLMRAAREFARVASERYKESLPRDYDGMVTAYNRGICELVIVVALTGADKSVQFAADVGVERKVIATVPMRDAAAPLTIN